mgnify:CR=1 FL=1
MKKCLITGAGGFAASHLIDLLLKSQYEVVGSIRIRDDLSNIKHLNIPLEYCDILDKFGVESIIKKVKPDIIFHLAAQSFVGMSWDFPELTLQTNIIGTLNLLEAVRKYSPECIFHLSSSSQIYGKVKNFPMTLDTPFNPQSPYDVSKLAQEMLVRQYSDSFGLDVRITRAFNITGPKRYPQFAETNFAQQIAKLEKYGGDPVIKVGNLESSRDYIDVRDAVRGYLLSVEVGRPKGIYLLCSGIATKIKDMLDILISFSTLNNVKIEEDKNLIRPVDTPYMVGDNSKSFDELGWKVQIHLKETLKDLLDYYRSIV